MQRLEANRHSPAQKLLVWFFLFWTGEDQSDPPASRRLSVDDSSLQVVTKSCDLVESHESWVYFRDKWSEGGAFLFEMYRH